VDATDATRARDGFAEAHATAFAGWLDVIDGLDDAAWARPTGCPGWDVHDQLAHVIAIERGLLGDPPDEVAVPDDLDHVSGVVGRLTEVGVHARRGVPPAELVAEARDTFDRRLAMLQALDPGVLGEPVDHPLGFTVRGSQLLRLRLFDVSCHEQDVRRAVGRLGPDRAAHLDVAVEQVLRLWARGLPDRLGGSGAVAVTVGSRPTVTIDLAGGRLHRAGDAGGGGDGGERDAVPEPRATLAVDVATLLALAGGRADAPAPGELDANGDAEVVARWVAAAGVTP
jgi:uncharacterized protein (TIGR03083 family)